MKLLKKIFYGICILIVICCGVVLIVALNPSLTDSVSEMLAERIAAEEQPGIESPVIEMLPSTPEYEAPSQEDVKLPEAVDTMVGFQPVSGQEQQIADSEAKELKESLETGPLGEKLTFSAITYPYYGMLNEEQRALYRQIYANVVEGNESFKPAINFHNDDLKKVFEAVYNDHPELFWLETAYSSKYLQNGQCIEIILKYNETIKNIKEAKQKFEAEARDIIAKTEQYAKLETKEKIVHDELVERVAYKTEAPMGQSAYSALVNKQSVCAGYARAFQYIMQCLGIPCYYCTGYSEGNHAWNIIKLGGRYYNVDVTWDDTYPSTYDYYNKTDEEYAATHVRTGLSVKLPACVENASDDVVYVGSEEKMEPLEWPLKPFDSQEAYEEEQRKKKQENLDKAKITEDEVLDNMDEYYKDCLAQMEKVGAGLQSFSNVIPQTLWSTVEQAYSQGTYKKGYVEEGLKKLEMEHFAIQLQVEDINGGYYRLHHNISTWKIEEEDSEKDSEKDSEEDSVKEEESP